MTTVSAVVHCFRSARRAARAAGLSAAVLSCLGVMALAAAPARAQLLFSLTPAARTGAPGATVTYTGTLINQSASTIFLDSLSAPTNDPLFTVDFFSFLGYVPASLEGGGSYSGSVFDLRVSPGAAAGQSSGGVVSILGGATSGAGQTVASTDFFIVVTPAPPAAAVFALCGAAFGGTAALRRRRRRGA